LGLPRRCVRYAHGCMTRRRRQPKLLLLNSDAENGQKRNSIKGNSWVPIDPE
jgi:hypothetical protein